jgi:hypothetical protein
MMSDAQAITSTDFFAAWVETCDQRLLLLSSAWSNCPLFTAHILDEPKSVIKTLAEHFKLECYCGYYCIDAILFHYRDRVPAAPPGQTWVRGIRVGFEHENFFASGLFQEVSHLLITQCDLRVLVSYPDSDDQVAPELERLHSIISGTDQSESISQARSFLFITGERNPATGAIKWHGRVYEREGWQEV